MPDLNLRRFKMSDSNGEHYNRWMCLVGVARSENDSLALFFYTEDVYLSAGKPKGHGYIAINSNWKNGVIYRFGDESFVSHLEYSKQPRRFYNYKTIKHQNANE